MSPLQRQYYEENRETVVKIVQKWRRFGFRTDSDQLAVRCALQTMRMSCDSPYLVDGNTDVGMKSNELMVSCLSSNWNVGHVLFHGGIPSKNCNALIERFRQDPGCRVCLSTDAGGVGLSRQHAHMVVNMDLPWNPAVLEQWIGRVPLLGQKSPVQVVNLVAQGTIEEGMLSILSFEKSVFAGVLDGGEKEAMLGGGSLKRLMKIVDSVSTTIPEAANDSNEGSHPTAKVNSKRTDSAIATSSEAFTKFAEMGLELLSKILAPPQSGRKTRSAPVDSPVRVEEADGRTYLKVEGPSTDALRQMAISLRTALDRFIA